LATQLWVIEAGQLCVHQGDYSEYLHQAKVQEEAAEGTRPKRQAKQARQQVLDPKQQREAKQSELETTIHQLETRLAQLMRELEKASAKQRVNHLYDLGQEYEELQQQLHNCLEEWSGVAQT
jgi:ATPase subunit of ABC transporter with duplicated ATPase domains